MVGVRKAVPLLVSVGALLIAVAPGLQYYYVTDVKEQWREAVTYVDVDARAGDVIVFAPNDDGMQQWSFNWYYRGSLPTCGLDINLKDEVAMAGALMQCSSHYERFWLVMRGRSETIERFKTFFMNSRHTNIRLTKEKQFIGISVYLFELPTK